MKKILSALISAAILLSFCPPSIFADADGENTDSIAFTADSGAELEFELLSENLIECGSFDSEADMDGFTTAGTTSKLSEVPSYWRYNAEGWAEAIGNGGSGSRQSLQTFIPLNGGEKIGEEKTYYFTMRVKGDDKQKALGWNMTTAAGLENQYDATVSGGRYPYYVAESDLDNNAMTFVKSDWITINDIIVASPDAAYLLIDGRWLGASSSSPVCFDDIALYEVRTKGAEAVLYENDYIVTDGLPEIDGVWSDTAGYVADGVYTRPVTGGLDIITARYADGETESFNVEVIGENVVSADGGIYGVKSGNLLKNVSFEKYYTNNRSDGGSYPYFPVWESTITGSNDASINNAENGCFYVKSEQQVTGRVSMRGKFDDAYNNHASFEQKAVLDKGIYYLSFYARKTDSGKRNMEIRLDGEPCFNFYDSVTLNTDWQRLSTVFEVEKDGTEFAFDAYNISAVYFDAFSLVEVEGFPTEVTVNLYCGEELLESETYGGLVEGAYYSFE
ncbi:MAG: hypothetical protein ACI4SS_02900, partial [Clostridia bacterium]